MAPKLSGPNHRSWAQGIQERLQKLGLWPLFPEPEKAKDADASSSRSVVTARRQASRVIVDTLEPHVVRELLLTALPSNLWNVLEEKYRDQAYGSVMDKACAYFDARLDETQMTLDEHIVNLGSRVHELAIMGFSVEEHIQVMTLLRSLKGSRYATFVKDTRRLPEPPTLTSLVEKLLQYRDAQEETSKQAAPLAEITTSIESSSTWGSMVSSVATASTSPEFTEEIMHAVARAVGASSSDSSAQGVGDSTENQAPDQRLQPCACSCKRC
jgi:hypothetical protein